MVALLDLWLAILLSAVIVFVASSIIHMVLQIHKGDYSKLPDEEEARIESHVLDGSLPEPAADAVSKLEHHGELVGDY